MSSIYGDIILDHYQFPRNNTRLIDPTERVHVDNPLCGDELDFDVCIENDHVTEVGFTGKGCAISTASASLLTEHIKNQSVEKILSLTKDSVLGLLHIELTPNRLKCALLALEGIQKAVNNAKKG